LCNNLLGTHNTTQCHDQTVSQ